MTTGYYPRYGFHAAPTAVDAAVLSLRSGVDVDVGAIAFPTLEAAVRIG